MSIILLANYHMNDGNPHIYYENTINIGQIEPTMPKGNVERIRRVLYLNLHMIFHVNKWLMEKQFCFYNFILIIMAYFWIKLKLVVSFLKLFFFTSADKSELGILVSKIILSIIFYTANSKTFSQLKHLIENQNAINKIHIFLFDLKVGKKREHIKLTFTN